MSRWSTASLASALAWLLSPCAAFPAFNVDVRDASTGQFIQAHVIAYEYVRSPLPGHGSRSWCDRADAVVAEAPSTLMSLPGFGTFAPLGTRGVGVLAYYPGYCVGGGTPQPDVIVSMRRATHGPEERLLYLADLTRRLVCEEGRWSNRSKAAMSSLADALVTEARSLAKTRYEKSLLLRLEGRINHVRQMPDGDKGYPKTSMQGKADEYRLPITIPVSRLTVLCDDGPGTCDINERDASGETMLARMVRLVDADSVRLLLESGADPTIASAPDALPPIEIALRALLYSEPGSVRATNAGRLVDLLIAHPRMTITRALKSDLEADPSSWKMVNREHGYERLLERREALRRLPSKADGRFLCPGEALDWRNSSPLRLRPTA